MKGEVSLKTVSWNIYIHEMDGKIHLKSSQNPLLPHAFLPQYN